MGSADFRQIGAASGALAAARRANPTLNAAYEGCAVVVSAVFGVRSAIFRRPPIMTTAKVRRRQRSSQRRAFLRSRSALAVLPQSIEMRPMAARASRNFTPTTGW